VNEVRSIKLNLTHTHPYILCLRDSSLGERELSAVKPITDLLRLLPVDSNNCLYKIKHVFWTSLPR
jgi:hypothetical protein